MEISPSTPSDFNILPVSTSINLASSLRLPIISKYPPVKIICAPSSLPTFAAVEGSNSLLLLNFCSFNILSNLSLSTIASILILDKSVINISAKPFFNLSIAGSPPELSK